DTTRSLTLTLEPPEQILSGELLYALPLLSDIAKVTYDNLKNKNSSFRYLLAESIPRMNRGMT
ncbi:hypothetical protein OZD61_03595, partial [Wolbachia endosymbiont of Drosophila bocki]|uniref:hypothetical protein n=1 Tax=Wolbachia endosymbiont of Drosophila leontia TaxID=3002580 RepID=UPI0023A9BF17